MDTDDWQLVCIVEGDRWRVPHVIVHALIPRGVDLSSLRQEYGDLVYTGTMGRGGEQGWARRLTTLGLEEKGGTPPFIQWLARDHGARIMACPVFSFSEGDYVTDDDAGAWIDPVGSTAPFTSLVSTR